MKVFLIAGEPSGDVIGGKLINAMRKQHPEAAFHGVGGPLMQEAGMTLLLPMKEMTVMGIWEVLMRVPHLWRIMIGIIEEIERLQPEVVVTVDFPDFNFILASKLKKRGKFEGRIVHYVAPTVWAWRPGRARKIAQFLDGLVCLLPFEPPYFEKHGLPTIFIGHPVTQENPLAGNGRRYREEYGIPDDAKVLGLFFGSREEEFEKLGRVLVETAIYMTERFKNLYVVMPTLQQFEYNIHNLTADLDCPKFVLLDNKKKKWDAFAAMDAAVAVSGTVGLELAYADVPHAIAYKTSFLNWVVIKAMVKVKYAHLANIIVNEPVVPEFLQQNCKSEKIAACIEGVLKGEENAAAHQKAGFAKMRDLLGIDLMDSPSDRAAQFVSGIARQDPKFTAIKKVPGQKAAQKNQGRKKPAPDAKSSNAGASTSASSSERKAAQQGPYTIDGAVQYAETVLQSFLSTVKSILQSLRQRTKR